MSDSVWIGNHLRIIGQWILGLDQLGILLMDRLLDDRSNLNLMVIGTVP